jgi:DNA-directed RNA polymerase I and III subunit RPAC1
LANALRRILISEIPSLAIEQVYIYNNTSVIQDEVLASRLGLVPLTGPAEGMHWLQWLNKPEDEWGIETPDAPSDFNTVVLRLSANCTLNEDASPGEKDPRKLYHNAHVYAGDITHSLLGRQDQFFGPGNEIKAANPEILLAKLRPGQNITLEMHAIKGVGADHAKFSPVATATYRLLPDIKITKPILGADAVKFSRCFPPGVIGLDTVTAEEASRRGSGYEGHEGEGKAVVVDPFKDTVSRECLRHEEFEGKVKLGRVRDHFIFNIESVGQYHSDALFLESIRVLRLKGTRLKATLQRRLQQA